MSPAPSAHTIQAHSWETLRIGDDYKGERFWRLGEAGLTLRRALCLPHPSASSSPSMRGRGLPRSPLQCPAFAVSHTVSGISAKQTHRSATSPSVMWLRESSPDPRFLEYSRLSLPGGHGCHLPSLLSGAQPSKRHTGNGTPTRVGTSAAHSGG